MKKGERTRQAIIHTAARLFESHGYFSTGIDDIAHELHIAKGTMYQYFKDKNELFQVIVRDAVEDLVHRYDRLQEETSDLQELINGMLYEINLFNVKQYDFSTIHLSAGSLPSDSAGGAYTPMRQLTVKVVDLLWPFRDELAMDVDKTAVMLIMTAFACRAYLLEMVNTPREQLTEEQIKDAAAEFGIRFLNGFRRS